jgi:membrane-bound metal-dependent hydrolase YbcI (DUF457 family)
MPTPLGHALVGLTISWSTQAISRAPSGHRTGPSLAFLASLFAIAPDFDFVYQPIHRMMTHSIVAAIAATACAAVVAHRTKQERPWVIAMVCGAAYASHLALDWLGSDTKQPGGIQLLWPFSDEWFLSSWHLFRPMHLGGFFGFQTMVSNVVSVLRELAILSPFAIGAWLLHARRAKPSDLPT